MSVSSVVAFANSSLGVVADHLRNASAHSNGGNEVEMCRELALALDVANYTIVYVNHSRFRNAISVVMAVRGIRDALDTIEKISTTGGIESKCHRYLNLKRTANQTTEEETDTGFKKIIRSIFGY